MAELGIVASVVQIADVGLRLSIRLYTFGEVVASADRSVISISKDISLTSGVLKELGQVLDKDRETGTFSENAVQTADGVVKECLEVFQEMESMLVKKMPSLAGGGGKDARAGERTKRATVLLERLKWGYLQPKLQLLRSNLDRLKSTLLLMLNVITYARQVSGKTESPSVIAEQRSLIEDLAHSNQEYIHKFEKLKLGIEGTPVEHVDDASDIGAVGRATPRMSLPGAPTGKLERMNFAFGGTPLQDKENTRSLGPRDLIAAARSSPKAQSSMVRSLATPPNANTNNVLINTSVHTNTALPPVQERGIPTTEAPIEFDQEVLFKQLKHYSMLIKNLLREVDEAKYEITFKSRLRVKGGIAGLHEGERQELEKMWGCTALRSAEQRFESLEEGLGELSRNRSVASKRMKPVFGLGSRRRERSTFKIIEKSPSMTANLGSDSKEQEKIAVWLPRATSDGRLIHFNSLTGASTMEDTFKIPVLVDEAAAKESSLITDVSESNPSEKMVAGAYTGNEPVPESDYYLSDKKYIKTSGSAPRALIDNSRNVKLFAPMADENPNAAEKGTKMQVNDTSTYDSMMPKTLRRKNVRGLILNDPTIQGCTGVSGDALGGAFSAASNTSDLRDAEGVRQTYGPTKNQLTQGNSALSAARIGIGNKPVMREHFRSTWREGTNSAVPDQLASGAEQPLTSTPASLVTPQYSFARSKADGQGSANMMPVMTSATPDQLAPQQQDTAMSGFNGLDGGVDESYSMPFNSDLNNSDVLENFDFEQFLQTTDRDFNFDPSTFETGDGIEIGGGIEIRPEEKPKGPFAGIDLDSVDGVLGRGRPEWWQREREQGDSRMADMEVVDRLVFLWTTVKSLSDVSNSECSKVFHPEVSLIENSEGLDPLMFLETH